MKRSLKLRIFAFVFLGVAIFVLASRLTIRYSASAPLITYQSELFGRQITRISNSHGDKTAIEKLQTHLVYAIEGLQPDEILVFSSQLNHPNRYTIYAYHYRFKIFRFSNLCFT